MLALMAKKAPAKLIGTERITARKQRPSVVIRVKSLAEAEESLRSEGPASSSAFVAATSVILVVP